MRIFYFFIYEVRFNGGTKEEYPLMVVLTNANHQKNEQVNSR